MLNCGQVAAVYPESSTHICENTLYLSEVKNVEGEGGSYEIRGRTVTKVLLFGGLTRAALNQALEIALRGATLAHERKTGKEVEWEEMPNMKLGDCDNEGEGIKEKEKV